MAFGAVMDPRMKFIVIEYAYPKIYHGDESMRNVQHVRCLLYEMYEEYVRSSEAEFDGDGGIAGGSSRSTTNLLQSVDHQSTSKKYSGWHDFTSFVSSKISPRPIKSDLDNYLEDGLELCSEGQKFDVIAWWKNNQAKYRILSRMAVDILSIPVSTVASESTFSAGERVVHTYRSKLGVDTVQALLCGSNWVRCHYGLKGRVKVIFVHASFVDIYLVFHILIYEH
ncbi:Putative AC9 transposase [Dendrobium catenatum]|uniref:AC9 transposase n=1 Tax=Dendrobium catenatum TaxID=906689 RepID=A0A2I0WAL4_9ASPA|nr:Putative AC9 transposase [Dendrobium catenatum]